MPSSTSTSNASAATAARLTVAVVVLALATGAHAATAASASAAGKSSSTFGGSGGSSVKATQVPATPIVGAAATTTPAAGANAGAGSSIVTGGACPTPTADPSIVAMAKTAFPAPYVTATIVKGDTVASSLWSSIQANPTYSAALALPTMKFSAAGNPVFSGYNAGADPACWWTDTNCVQPKQKYLPKDHVQCNEPRTWGLSIDDGPLPAHCNLYKLYAENGITASTFFIGSNVVAYPASAAEALEGGHVICVHTWSHHYTTSLSNDVVFAELYYTKLAIKRVLGYTPRCFRPPYGDTDDRVRTIAYALEMDTWLWSDDTNDWQLGTAPGQLPQPAIQKNFDTIISKASDTHGTIVLDHELSIPVAGMWMLNYPAIKAAFTNIVAAHTCENVTAPWAEPDAPRYPAFADWIGGAKATGSLQATVNTSAQIYFAGVGANQATPFTDAAGGSGSKNASVAGYGNGLPVVGAVNGTVLTSSNTSSAAPLSSTTGSAASFSFASLSSSLFAVGIAAFAGFAA